VAMYLRAAGDKKRPLLVHLENLSYISTEAKTPTGEGRNSPMPECSRPRRVWLASSSGAGELRRPVLKSTIPDAAIRRRERRAGLAHPAPGLTRRRRNPRSRSARGGQMARWYP